MNDIILNIISVVVTAVVIPLFTLLGKKLIEWVNLKIDNELGKKHVENAINVVVSVVKEISQTYVQELKKQNAFDKEAQTEALRAARAQAGVLIRKETKEYIEKVYSDFDDWLDIQIEAAVADNK